MGKFEAGKVTILTIVATLVAAVSMLAYVSTPSFAKHNPDPTATATASATATPDNSLKIEVCHKDGNSGNFSDIDVSVHSVNDANGLNGHGNHDGDIWSPFTYNGQGFGGHGDYIHTNFGDCSQIDATATPTPTASPTASATPTETPTSTPTPIPTATATATPTSTPNDFVFPQCSDLIGIDGDKAHYGFGNPHQIVGENGQRYGSDDVYILEGGNYLQCFCPDEGNTGIQTNWLLTGDPNGIFGLVWDLGPYFYNTQNLEFSCKTGATPTPESQTPEPANNGSTQGASAPVCSASKPGTPEILSIVQNGTSATLIWSSVASATHYSIVYGDIPGKYSFGIANTGNVTSYTIDGLTLGTVYHYGVIAVNDCMPGDPGTYEGGTGGQVLGASTMAATGTFEENLYMSLMLIGGLITAFGLKSLKNSSN